MARGKTLGTLIVDLRAAIGVSTSSIVGQQDLPEIKSLLNRHQRLLYETVDWPFLKIRRDVTLQAGQQYYDFPDDMNEEGVRCVEVRYNGQWSPVIYGIGAEQYNQLDPQQTAASVEFYVVANPTTTVTSITVGGVNVTDTALNPAASGNDAATFAAAIAAEINSHVSTPEYTAAVVGNKVTVYAPASDGAGANGRVIAFGGGADLQLVSTNALSGGTTGVRNDPVERWQVINTGTDQLEVWPLPSSSGSVLRFYGIHKLDDLVNDSDVSLLSGDLIVAFAAAEKRAGKDDGELKANIASRLLTALKGNSSKSGSFKFGERTQDRQRTGTVIRISGGA